jgi:hypothetical protein
MSKSSLGIFLGAPLLGLLLVACGDKSPAAVPPTAPSPAAAASAAAPALPVAASPAASEPAAMAISSSADRVAPPVVPPVIRDGVRYAQAEDGRSVGMNQVGGVLVASEVPSRKRLWTLAVYSNEIDPQKEADAQWVFFKSMAFDPDGRLRIVNEAGNAFLVDVKTQKVAPAN